MNRLGSQRVRMSFLASALLAGSLQAMNLGEIWRYFKWPITIAVMVVLALASWALLKATWKDMFTLDTSQSSIFGGGKSEETGEEKKADPTVVQPGTGPVENTTLKPIAAFGVSDGKVLPKGDGYSISDQPLNRMVVAFDVPKGNPACVATLEVNMKVQKAKGQVVLGLFPSKVTDPKAVQPGSTQPSDLTLSPTPMSLNALGNPGEFAADITAHFADWFSMNHPAGTPFTLTVAPAEAVAPGEEVVISSTPTLTVKGTPDCK